MNESEVQQYIQIEGPHHGCILLRNNSGALKDVTGRMVRYGLGNTSQAHNENFKSSDLIGITSVVVTPEMVGETIGVFTAVEVKRDDWKPSKTSKREKAQSNFIEWTLKHGGMAGFANNIETFKQILCRFQAR